MERRTFLKNSIGALLGLTLGSNKVLSKVVESLTPESTKVLLFLIQNRKGEWKIRGTKWIDLPKRRLKRSDVYIETFKPLEIVDNELAQKRRMELWKEYNCSGRTGADINIDRSYRGGLMRKEDAVKQFRKISTLGGKTSHKLNPELYKKWGNELGKIQAKKIHICPHCNKIGKTSSMFTWHFDNCLKNPNGPKKLRIEIRNSKGEKNHNSILTNSQAEEIRKIYIPFDKEFGQTPLSKKYNVSRNTINKIVNHYTYNQ